MEIHINVPPAFQPVVFWSQRIFEQMHVFWTHAIDAKHMLSNSVHHVFELPRNAFLPIFAVVLVFWPVLLSLVMAFAAASTWIFWLVTSILLGLLQLGYATYQFFMIAGDIFGLSVLKTYSMMRNTVLYYLDKSGMHYSRRRQWRRAVEDAGCYENFLKIGIENKDERRMQEKPDRNKQTDSALPPLTRSQSYSLEDSPTRRLPRNRSFSGEVLRSELKVSADPVVIEELGSKTADLLVKTTARLREARLSAEADPSDEAASSLKFLLSGVVKRNHLTLEDILVENARSIAQSGRYGLTKQTRQQIRAYYEEVQKGLDWISDAPLNDVDVDKNGDGFSLERQSDLAERITLVRKMKQNMGRTALMLSGGGAQAMYHLGIIRALIESKIYDDIRVISGTSGGSIAAAMCAIKTADELYSDVCVPTVSTDYMKTGEMKKKNIRWFPTITEMGAYWMKHKLLVDSAYFRRTCEFYFQDITFEEAFLRTGKHVCITVSASRATGDSAQRLLLNHISTPHVTIASAVAASCALPGVMAPAKLIAKNSNGILEPFEVDGVEWIDGSVQADLPFQRISTLFAVTSFIVSQTNFHVVPFLNKEHHPSKKSVYWRLFQTMEWDIRNRALKLSRLGLFPRIFGQDISKVFKQKYYGNLTIVPRFTTMQTFGLKALSNPNVKDMEGYLKYGQIATWPYLNSIRDMIRLEKSLDDSLLRLEERARHMHPDADWSAHDDVESIASSSMVAAGSGGSRVRIVGRPPPGLTALRDRESERLRQRAAFFESENKSLKAQVEQLKRLLGDKAIDVPESKTRKEEDEGSDTDLNRASLSEGSEGDIWNIVLRKKS